MLKIVFRIIVLAVVLLILTRAPKADGHHSTVEQWRSLVEKILPDEDTDRVLRIMWCESRGKPDARYTEEWGHDSIGLMQINARWLDGWGTAEWAIPSHNGEPVDLTDPVANLQATKWIRHLEGHWGQQPWENWACA